MAARQCGSFRAARADLGRGEISVDVGVGAKVDVNAYLGLGLKTPSGDRVSIGWGAAVAGMIGAADGGDAE